MSSNGAVEKRQIDARSRVGGHFDGPDAQSFEHLKNAEVGRALDGHVVARHRDRAQGQVQGLHAPARDDDVVGIAGRPGHERPSSDLTAKKQLAAGRPVGRAVQRPSRGRLPEGAIDARCRKERRAQRRHPERNELGVARLAEDFGHELADAHRYGRDDCVRHERFRQRPRRRLSDVKPRAVPRADVPVALEPQIRFRHGCGADAAASSEGTNGRKLVAGAQHAAVNLAPELGCQTHVERVAGDEGGVDSHGGGRPLSELYWSVCQLSASVSILAE